jgi:hypothetical protein
MSGGARELEDVGDWFQMCEIDFRCVKGKSFLEQ